LKAFFGGEEGEAKEMTEDDWEFMEQMSYS